MSIVFDLDKAGRRTLDEDAARNPLRLEDIAPPAWQGTTDALKGFLRPSAGAGRALFMAGAPAAIGLDKLQEAGRAVGDTVSLLQGAGRPGATMAIPEQAPITSAQDWYFRNVVDDLGGTAVDAWTPNPEAMGSAAKAVNVGGNVIGTLPQIFGTPSLFLASSGFDPATELVRQGVDPNTAATVGGISLAANALGLRLPAAWGTTLTQRLASGTGANLGLGLAMDAASAGVLDAAGFQQQAEGYDVTDPYARALDILMGAAFGYKAHIDAPPLLTHSQRDAVLTARNSDHAHRQTLPGDPTTPAAARAHTSALGEAMEQLARGEQVNVAEAVRLEDFVLRPELQPGPAVEGLQLRGGSEPEAVQADYTAIGERHGFRTTSTTRSRAENERVGGVENSQHLEHRGTARDWSVKGKTQEQIDAFVADLRAAGFEVITRPHGTGPHIHAELPRGGRRPAEPARAADAAPARAAEPAPPKLTPPEAGTVIDRRLATLDALATQGRLPDEQFRALQAEDVQLVETLRRSEGIERTGVVPADPRSRLTPEQVETASARRIEIRQALEQHRAARSYEQQAAQLRSRLDRIDRDADLVRLAERLDGDRPEVRLPPEPPAARAPDAPAPRQADAGPRPPARPDQPASDRQARQPDAPAPDAGTAAATRTAARTAPDAASGPQRADQPGRQRDPGARAQPAQDGAAVMDEALRVATESPGLQVIDGFDADGNPLYRPASDVLADIEAERQRAVNEARAFPAAVSCFLRMGS